ncbi:MAG TPA: helix-turn-helix domain-containing protein [Candidatus Acidoferrum sp.]|nr:helix-turn-helix domain-containing protein [Candidatus Acidoferrum sp.]
MSLVSRRDAAQALAVTTKTIYRYERAGLLKGVRLNSRTVRYHRADLNRLVAESQ